MHVEKVWWDIIPFNAEVKITGHTQLAGERYQLLWDAGYVPIEREGSRFRPRDVISRVDCVTREEHQAEIHKRHAKWIADDRLELAQLSALSVPTKQQLYRISKLKELSWNTK